jgi:hypothetical protein
MTLLFCLSLLPGPQSPAAICSGPCAQITRNTLPPAFDTLAPSRFSGGFFAGVNTEFVNPSRQIFSVRPRIGYSLRYDLSARASLQAELGLTWADGYNQHRSMITAAPNNHGDYSAVDFNVNRLGFLELPVMGRRVSANGRFSWLAGIRTSLVLPFDDTKYRQGGENPPPQNRSLSVGAGIRRFDLGLTAGIEWKISRKLWLDFRYSQGLVDLTRNSFFQNDVRHLHSGFQASVHIPFVSRASAY